MARVLCRANTLSYFILAARAHPPLGILGYWDRPLHARTVPWNPFSSLTPSWRPVARAFYRPLYRRQLHCCWTQHNHIYCCHWPLPWTRRTRPAYHGCWHEDQQYELRHTKSARTGGRLESNAKQIYCLDGLVGEDPNYKFRPET